MKFSLFALSIVAFFSHLSCADSLTHVEAVVGLPSVQNPPVNRPDGWDEYWYNGKAEVNAYEVVQERYGENRESEVVLVFVTEPFLPEAQVKDDNAPTKEKAISVFKLNRLEKFETGIYDYALMLSTFTPVSRDQYPNTLKTTFSAQDWCGQVWTQLNYRKGAYQVEARSYFQQEADENRIIETEFLEDELVSLVRLNPDYLPSGKTKLIPAAKFSRLRHVPLRAEDAIVDFAKNQESGQLELTVVYPTLQREVTFNFEEAFPNKLLGWTESYRGNFLSSAKLKNSLREKYWGQNSNANSSKREALGL